MNAAWEELKVGKRWVAPVVVAVLLLAMMGVDVVRVLSRPVSGRHERVRIDEPVVALGGLDFTSGFSIMEERGIWAVGRRSVLTVRVEYPTGAVLRLVCRPCPDLDEAQILTLRLNGTELAELDLAPGNHRYEVAVAGQLLRRGANSLEFSFAVHRPPVDAAHGTAVRPLAVHFSSIELLSAADGRSLIPPTTAPATTGDHPAP